MKERLRLEISSDELGVPKITEKKMVRRSVATALGIICILLVVVGLVGGVAYIAPMINTKDSTISNLQTSLNENIIAYNNYVEDHNYTNEQYVSENASAYELGYKAGVTSRGFDIVDPTYQQMLSFMATDTVHNNAYNSTYVCWNFANDYINEAFRAGWRCGFVYIDFPVYAHAVVCFNTTNRGIVFVEPQANKIVNVAVGLSYWSSNGFAPVTYNDTIVSFGIIW
jgi:hypothetical protein